jgi:hypothetical protein
MTADDKPPDAPREGDPPGSGEQPPGSNDSTPARGDDAPGKRHVRRRRSRRLSSVVPDVAPVVKAAEVVDGVVDAAADVASRATPEPVVRAASAVGAAVGAAARRWDERPGARVRRVRRMAREVLPYLYDAHPEARQAIPRDLGMRTVGVDEIIGTAVGPPAQRGRDFLPLKPFRSQNWQARWQRMRQAIDRLAVLPPIDAILYDGGYWVLDGHNRVAAGLYGGQLAVDANVTELTPLGKTSTERAGSLASTAADGRAVRTRGAGNRIASELEDEAVPRPLDDVPP